MFKRDRAHQDEDFELSYAKFGPKLKNKKIYTQWKCIIFILKIENHSINIASTSEVLIYIKIKIFLGQILFFMLWK